MESNLFLVFFSHISDFNQIRIRWRGARTKQEPEEQVILCVMTSPCFRSLPIPDPLSRVPSARQQLILPKVICPACYLIRLQCHKYTSRLLWLQTRLCRFFLLLSFLWLWTQKGTWIYLRILISLISDWGWKVSLQCKRRERKKTLVLKLADTVCAIHTADQWGIIGFSKQGLELLEFQRGFDHWGLTVNMFYTSAGELCWNLLLV